MTIFDAHAHLQPASFYVDDARLEADATFRKELFARCGISAGIVMASNVYERPDGIADTRRQNDVAAAFRDRYPDTFPVAMGTVEPNYGVEVCLAEINRMHSTLGIKGVVWHHHFSGNTIDEPRMIALTRELARLSMVAMVHLNMDSINEAPTHLEGLAQAVPEATIIGLGAFASHRNLHDLRAIGKRCPNVLLETSLAFPMGQNIVAFAELLGSERLLFGTDMHFEARRMWRYPPGLQDILESDRLTEADRENILWRNAERVFGVWPHPTQC
ncbi:MAG: amidohydrolase family protein [Chloroflexi bacterium]|nr:amidohydrolase family protein [Chloroflexota bacterium]